MNPGLSAPTWYAVSLVAGVSFPVGPAPEAFLHSDNLAAGPSVVRLSPPMSVTEPSREGHHDLPRRLYVCGWRPQPVGLATQARASCMSMIVTPLT